MNKRSVLDQRLFMSVSIATTVAWGCATDSAASSSAKVDPVDAGNSGAFEESPTYCNDESGSIRGAIQEAFGDLMVLVTLETTMLESANLWSQAQQLDQGGAARVPLSENAMGLYPPQLGTEWQDMSSFQAAQQAKTVEGMDELVMRNLIAANGVTHLEVRSHVAFPSSANLTKDRWDLVTIKLTVPVSEDGADMNQDEVSCDEHIGLTRTQLEEEMIGSNAGLLFEKETIGDDAILL